MRLIIPRQPALRRTTTRLIEAMRRIVPMAAIGSEIDRMYVTEPRQTRKRHAFDFCARRPRSGTHAHGRNRLKGAVRVRLNVRLVDRNPGKRTVVENRVK